MSTFDFDSFEEEDAFEPHRREYYSDTELAELLRAAQSGALSVEALESLVGYNYENSNYDEALKFLDVLIDFAPYSSEAWERRGMIYNNLGKYKEALEAFERA